MLDTYVLKMFLLLLMNQTTDYTDYNHSQLRHFQKLGLCTHNYY